MLERDRELLKEYQSYFDWVKALWKRLIVDRSHPERRFRLTIDDDELREVQQEGAPGFTAAVRRFCKAYYYDVYRAAEAADRIARSNKLKAPGSLGILAACVLTAARMGSEGRFNAIAYHPRFNSEILGLDSSLTPDGFEYLGDKWQSLREAIRNEGYGSLVLPKDPRRSPLRNKRHINYPLSQCLFRRIDVDRLSEFLSNLSDDEISGEEAFDRLLGYVDYHQNVSVALEAALRGARTDADLREAYVAALDDLIADSARRIRAERRVASRIVKASEFGLARLRLVPEYARDMEAYDIILETLRDSEWDPDETFRCETNDVLDGVTVERFGIRYKYLGADAAVFFLINDYDLVTQRNRKLPAYARIVVVAAKGNETELRAFGEALKIADDSITEPVKGLQLLARFEALVAIQFTFSSRGLNATALPRCLARFGVAAETCLTLKGGLAVEGGYLIGVPLRLELTMDQDADRLPDIFCDNQKLIPVEFEDRFEYDARDFSNRPGQHFVTSSQPSLKLAFTVVDPPRSLSVPPEKGPFNAMYFGPQFLRFISDAANLKKARKQALEPGSAFVLMYGASITHAEERQGGS